MSTTVSSSFHWKCRHTWQRSAKNTLWCLLGCSIGDFGTILFFQLSNISWPTLNIMVLAIINGLITSIALETIILFRQMNIISMISMEVSMNAVDWIVVGGAEIVWWVVPIMLLVGFITPWPYNYWRLKKFNTACH